MDTLLLEKKTIIDLILVAFYIIGIFYLLNRKVKGNKFKRLFFLIGIEHLIFTIIYYYYTLSNVSDAVGYYRRVMFVFEDWESTFGQGVYFIYTLLYPLAKILNVSYFGCYFFFSFIGLIGIKLLLDIVQDIYKSKWSKWYYLLLLPNLHFWTVAIGKDSLIFYGIVAFTHGIYFKKKWVSFIIPILIVGFIRIHILGFVFLAFLFSRFLLNKNVKIVYKVFSIVLLVASFIIITPIIEERIGVGEEENLQERIEELQNSNQLGGSSVNFSDANIVVKWLAYLTRPLFFDAHNALALVVSVENLIWLFSLLYIFLNIKKKRKRILKNYFFVFVFLAFMIISIPSAYILTNFGIAVRQKMMIFPYLLIMVFLLTSYNNPIMKSINGK